ncbi:MAG: riboflavin synthase [Candidatus Levybacteria bacterium]|nr:riboflavin synthase [Candidatus Levybacteria bacterium]
MFTGIITHVGKVKERTANRLVITTSEDLVQKVTLGMSIAVNGICLTAVTFDDTSFAIEYMPETAARTNIQNLKEGSLVNLELPATSETFLAGHIVQGHIDGVGKIDSILEAGNSRILTISLPQDTGKYIVEKGSITLNGISLTVIDVTDEYFTVGIIPHTWEKTMLYTTRIHDSVNIEVDVLAKYLEKLVAAKK